MAECSQKNMFKMLGVFLILNSLMTYYYHLFHKIKNIYMIIVEKVILE